MKPPGRSSDAPHTTPEGWHAALTFRVSTEGHSLAITSAQDGVPVSGCQGRVSQGTLEEGWHLTLAKVITPEGYRRTVAPEEQRVRASGAAIDIPQPAAIGQSWHLTLPV